MIKRVLPEGTCCEDIHVFGESSMCPDLADGVTLHPECRKYDVELGWTVSGRVLKCSECLSGGRE